MAKPEGKHYTNVRAGKYTRADIPKVERHNERKNLEYENLNIDLDRTDMNIYFKKPTKSYSATFDEMIEEGIISTKGLKSNAVHYGELLFDVNTAYFEERGGYQYASEFFAKAYAYAVKEVGGEEYILSAVMHADERNAAVSEQLGKDVYHYHLHVVYIPVVQKEVKWSKRCKNQSLVGTVKEVINQVSHSKKWKSEKIVGEDGKSHLVKSYSMLQDKFFEYMSKCGYTDVERGIKGSTTKHLSSIEFMRNQEQMRLDSVLKKKVKVKSIDNIETKSVMFGGGKLMVDEEEFGNIKTLAQRQVVSVSKERKLMKKNQQLKEDIKALQHTHQLVKAELADYKSVRKQLVEKTNVMRVVELENFQKGVYQFLEKYGIRNQFDAFMKGLIKQKNIKKQKKGVGKPEESK